MLSESRGQEHRDIFELAALQMKDETETEPKLLIRPLRPSEVRQNQQRFHYSQIPPDVLNHSKHWDRKIRSSIRRPIGLFSVH